MGNKLDQSCLICLRSLRTLVLHCINLPEVFNMPSLTTLHPARCTLPKYVFDLPALSTLKLSHLRFPQNARKFLPSLVNLRNLTLCFYEGIWDNCVIDCPHLVNLEITTSMNTIPLSWGKINLFAPKLRNFNSLGFFPITSGVSKLETVSMKLRGCITSWFTADSEKLEIYYRQVINMFPALGSTSTLNSWLGKH